MILLRLLMHNNDVMTADYVMTNTIVIVFTYI